MKKIFSFLFLVLFIYSCKNETEITKGTADSTDTSSDYEFVGGYPTEATIKKAYDDADLARAIQAYKFFYPTVSGKV